ncbi:cytosine permease [Porticoccaceae bacterium]|nr:cytosine permease [Porticoccaceae bacterium]MDB2394892.1 cytosine permease [Porticoccaceae bacterium]MDB2401104.1 cytosine permease [Porticoccaceae bacterium]
MKVESTEFSTEPVPDEHTVSWIRVAIIASMVAFSLPVFLAGVEIAISFSPLRTLEVFVVGTVILTIIGCITAAIGANTRLSSYMLNRIAFGFHGAALVNTAFAISLLGWFGVNIDLFSGAVQRLTVDIYAVSVPAWPIEIFAGLIMTVTTVFGFRAINTLSAFLVPVLIAVTAQLIVGSLTDQSLTQIMRTSSANELSFGDGVSAVVGSAIVGAVILPDITRFVRHWSGGIFVVLTSYLVIQFIVISAGGLSATALEDDDLLNIMLTLGIGWAAFAIVIFGSWVLNSLNLYSTMLSVESTAPKLNNTSLIIILGSLGTLAAFMNILNDFLSFLFYLAVIFVPVSGIIIVDYLILRRSAYHEDRLLLQQKTRPKAIAAWGLGACVALMGSWSWISITNIAALDAMIVAALAYYLLAFIGTTETR